MLDTPRSLSETPFQHRDVKLYSIAGYFCQPKRGFDAVAFGGYFRYDVLDKLVLDGQLIDRFGPSTIEGRMDDEVLVFDKEYQSRGYALTYEFTKRNGIWVGDYAGKTTGKGKAQCVCTPVLEDAFRVACGDPKLPQPTVGVSVTEDFDS